MRLLTDLQSSKVSRVHVKRLRAFVFDETRVDPATVVAADRSEFLVDFVLDHLPKAYPWRHRRELEFKIRWVGYGLEHDSWEPWSELRANDRVHAYMRANGMGMIISPLYAPGVVPGAVQGVAPGGVPAPYHFPVVVHPGMRPDPVHR